MLAFFVSQCVLFSRWNENSYNTRASKSTWSHVESFIYTNWFRRIQLPIVYGIHAIFFCVWIFYGNSHVNFKNRKSSEKNENKPYFSLNSVEVSACCIYKTHDMCKYFQKYSLSFDQTSKLNAHALLYPMRVCNMVVWIMTKERNGKKYTSSANHTAKTIKMALNK